ncbi:slipin family protein [Mycobacterium talmoniae]|uniref:Peptidase n=1 Tax=Mycobacterium talmoniae TaxID=1858794 RepID=A0A1S1NBI0_9MYCO|nr:MULTISPECIES: slipin family protein [Mycobacterium]OHU96071.1 peptidase [Mycobacterium talmoniae]TDH56176.1 slipin family protein [Mycobacterium eburneum]
MSLLKQLIVDAGQRALVYRDGTLSRVLAPGRHRLLGAVSVQVVDVRERVVALAPQEVLTSDAVSLRITVAVRIAVSDPVAYLENAADPVAAVYLAAQIALREVVADLSAEDVLRRGNRLDAAPIAAAARAAGTRTGIDVLDVYLKDVIVPAEIRSAAMELITAKTRGAAKLEAARAETAALRALANAGKLLDAHPALAQLRLIQAVPYGSRVALTVGGSDDAESADDAG